MLRPALALLRPSRLPSQCEICRQWVDADMHQIQPGALCADCISRFAAPRPRCQRCGLRMGVESPACGDCLRDAPPFEHTVCAVDYGFPWDGLVAAFKFHGRVELAFALAALMARAVHAAGRPAPHWVLPVPLSPRRLAERGYNQAWELARTLAATLGLRADAGLLLRHGDTAHQADLGRAERQRNLRSAFMVEPRRRTELQGARVALVDDVMTTGATVREAAALLRRAGAAAVDVWVLARTPEPR
ncbi:MAG: ComF family protein [Rubrivivax sp.]|nr:ComF family protein [Rubrivivax sp.]